MAPEPVVNRDKWPRCFVIGPYGAEDSKTRKWSDFVFFKVIEPVLRPDYVAQRTIDDPEPGRISDRIERDLNDAELVVADLTDGNSNVYFELGFRHALDLPVIHLARQGTTLPFDVKDYDVIFVRADYFEPRNFFVISDEDLEAAQRELRAQLKKIDDRPPRTTPVDPISAKVYRWVMTYSETIHSDWLAKQTPAFQDQIGSYENGGGADSVPESSLTLFAEYLALKSAASQRGQGTIFVTFNNAVGKLDVGFAAFKFSTAPQPILIDVTDLTCSGDGVATISFEQDSRPFSIERGGRTVTVTIPGYKYTLKTAPASESSTSLAGVIAHPRTRTPIGNAELTPRYGEFLR
jgi:hypothetical protein